MKNLFLLVFIVLLNISSNSFAAGPEAEERFYNSRQEGAAKYDLDYGYDEELDSDIAKKEAERKAKKIEELKKQKEKKGDDFFSDEVESWDKTTFEESKTK